MDNTIELTVNTGRAFLKKGHLVKDEFAKDILNLFGVEISHEDCEYIRCRWVWRTNKDGSRVNYIIKNPEKASTHGTFKATFWRSNV